MMHQSVRIGILWMVGSAAFLAIGNSVVRKIAVELHPFQIGFLANLLALIAVWPAFRVRVAVENRARRLKLYSIIAILGGVTNLTWFYALAHVPLAEATAITFAAPILVTALSGFLLGERVDGAHWLAIFAGFLGVLLIVRPGFAEIDSGVMAVLISTCGMASTYLISKKLMAFESARRAAAMMTVIPVVTGAVPAFLVWRTPSFTTMAWVAVMAVAMFLGRTAMLHAFRHAPASTVLPFDFARLPFIAVLAYIGYGEIPDGLALAGGSVVMVAAGWIFERERRREAMLLRG